MICTELDSNRFRLCHALLGHGFACITHFSNTLSLINAQLNRLRSLAFDRFANAKSYTVGYVISDRTTSTSSVVFIAIHTVFGLFTTISNFKWSDETQNSVKKNGFNN